MENVQIVSITETIWLDYSLSFCKLALMFTSKSANFCIFSLAVFFKWVGLHDKGFCLQAKFIWCFSQRLYIGIYSCPLLFHFLCLKWTYSAFVLRVKFQLLYRHWPFFFLPFLHFFTPFYQRLLLFKELSKIFKDFWRKFKDFSRISHNFPIYWRQTKRRGPSLLLPPYCDPKSPWGRGKAVSAALSMFRTGKVLKNWKILVYPWKVLEFSTEVLEYFWKLLE